MRITGIYTNRRIFTKILIGFIIVAGIAAFVGYQGVIGLNEITQSDMELYEEMTVPISETSKMLATFYQMRVDARDMIFADDIDLINEELANVHKGISEITIMSANFSKLKQSEEIEAAFDDFLESRAQYNRSLEQLYVFTRQNNDEEALALLNGEMSEAAEIQAEKLSYLIDLKIADAKAKADANQKLANQTIEAMRNWVIMAAVVALILGILISGLISRPIGKMVKAANSLADSNLDIKIGVNTKDEVGKLAQAFSKMTDNMNYALSNIWSASEQVASGAKQVSDSSMELSQGATEQASSIEQLTASLEEVSTQTKQNAEYANKANSIAETATAKAMAGNTQMQELLRAIDEINESSTSISKVIKVIDEIAFQTNILALNAAIEAARAGQYGKGFAVVAEEVRNLAARSANAAKETTDMLANSKKKAEDGTQIAAYTAEALEDIVARIKEVASLVGDIAVASNEQASAISQINDGVIQVSDVTQSNSATSEESAAASEELAGQAELLKGQVARFKLKSTQYSGEIKEEKTEKNDQAQDSELDPAAGDKPDEKPAAGAAGKIKAVLSRIKLKKSEPAKEQPAEEKEEGLKEDGLEEPAEKNENAADLAKKEAAAAESPTIDLNDKDFGKY